MLYLFFFFFNDTATTEIYTLSLHDALPIFRDDEDAGEVVRQRRVRRIRDHAERQVVDFLQLFHRADVLREGVDRKSTRLNSSHANISYAVFCLKKKKTTKTYQYIRYMIVSH